MSQSVLRSKVDLPGLPRQPLTPEQKLDALRRVQAQAEQRVKLGQQLFKAAEARVTAHRGLMDQVRQEQDKLRAEVQEDVARSLQSYDQFMGQLEERITLAMRSLEDRLDTLHAECAASESKVDQMLTRAEALLDQTRVLLNQSVPRGRATATEPAVETPVEDQEIFLDALKRLGE